MAGAVAARLLSASRLNDLFERVADVQYTRKLTFGALFDLMSAVVCGVYPSVHRAWRDAEGIAGSVQAVYEKLDGMEPITSAALVREMANDAAGVIDEIGGAAAEPLPGYRMKILDGHDLGPTEHRPQPLRGTAAGAMPRGRVFHGAMPGTMLAVVEPARRLVRQVVPCEDSYTQERVLAEVIVSTVKPGELWVADRNFCTRRVLFGLDGHGAALIIREHGQLPWERAGPRRRAGRTDSGQVYEQPVGVYAEDGSWVRLRRVELHLDTPTREGERRIVLLTNLPKKAAKAADVANLYRDRWKVEHTFQELAEHLHAEINTLAYPKAALFGYCVALVTYNAVSVITAALRSAHGREQVEQLSAYYMSTEIRATYGGCSSRSPSRHGPDTRR